jgi:RNA polymerase sigma-70 factor (ECF subfamily)
MSTVTAPDSLQSVSVPDFARIYREHASFIYRTAYGVTGSREDAEDILQAVFLRLMSGEFPPDFQKNPKGYLYRAAVNRSLDVIETGRRRPQLLKTAPVIETSTSPDDPCVQEERHRRLYEAIAKLSPKQAEVVALRYLHDLSDGEIAKMLAASRTAIAVRLFRARARLKKLIRKSPGEQA